MPYNNEFMDSSKRLAGLMNMSSAGKPARNDLETKADTSDAGFYKLDGTNAMVNTATNFAQGFDDKQDLSNQASLPNDKVNEIDHLSSANK